MEKIPLDTIVLRRDVGELATSVTKQDSLGRARYSKILMNVGSSALIVRGSGDPMDMNGDSKSGRRFEMSFIWSLVCSGQCSRSA